MSEEQTAPTATAETTTASPPGDAAATPGGTPAATWDLDTVLGSADREKLRHHPVFAGMLGGELDRAKRAWETAKGEQTRQEATEAEKTRLRELRRVDPYKYAEEMDAREEHKANEAALNSLRGETSSEFARRIGVAMSRIPEWSEATPQDHEALAQAVIGKSDDEVLDAFASKFADILAEKRTEKRSKEWTEKQLVREREALKKEVANELLQSGGSPDLMRSRGGGGRTLLDANPKSSEEWNRWNAEYERTVLRR